MGQWEGGRSWPGDAFLEGGVKPGVRCCSVRPGLEGSGEQAWGSEGRKWKMYKQDPHGTKNSLGLAEQKSMPRGASQSLKLMERKH